MVVCLAIVFIIFGSVSQFKKLAACLIDFVGLPEACSIVLIKDQCYLLIKLRRQLYIIKL